jgi:hypothetical protein
LAGKRDRTTKAHLEQLPRASYNIKQELPPRLLRLPRAIDNDLQALVEVVEELDDARKNTLFALCKSDVDASRRQRCVSFVFENGVEKDLEGVCEVDEVLVVRGEEDGFGELRAGKVETQNRREEEMRL